MSGEYQKWQGVLASRPSTVSDAKVDRSSPCLSVGSPWSCTCSSCRPSCRRFLCGCCPMLTTAGRLAQASRTCKQLLQHRLAAFIEAKRNELRAAAASRYQAGSRSAAICAHFERLTADVPIRYRCWCSPSTLGATPTAEPAIHHPCAIVLTDNVGRGLPVCLGLHILDAIIHRRTSHHRDQHAVAMRSF